ncbi:hypothetical protein [Pseudaquidulcibacter saccharophilus]|uniref:hypothetical protein n=1 Tax=Pseudaquidulcibacter saccharophilus TaxID=2831900 RepID=UPI001EFEF98B|nr:hypothetical protein [Pseudaquidulcibacter saccharophilus]
MSQDSVLQSNDNGYLCLSSGDLSGVIIGSFGLYNSRWISSQWHSNAISSINSFSKFFALIGNFSLPFLISTIWKIEISERKYKPHFVILYLLAFLRIIVSITKIVILIHCLNENDGLGLFNLLLWNFYIYPIGLILSVLISVLIQKHINRIAGFEIDFSASNKGLGILILPISIQVLAYIFFPITNFLIMLFTIGYRV